MSKKDFELGLEISKLLKEKGAETPLLDNRSAVFSFAKLDSIEQQFKKILEVLGLDLKDDSLKDTPRRVASMYIHELFYGLDYRNFPKSTVVSNKMQFDEMVTESGITSLSVCEHHFQTIDGKVTISYIPKDKILGLSKLNRITDFFSRRPQIQERLTIQIYYALSYILQTEDVAVKIDAVHYCIKCRGVNDRAASTRTSKLGGVYKNAEVRAEFFSS